MALKRPQELRLEHANGQCLTEATFKLFVDACLVEACDDHFSRTPSPPVPAFLSRLPHASLKQHKAAVELYRVLRKTLLEAGVRREPLEDASKRQE